ncbi:MAG: alpha/beta fold hydrolase [Thalassobaculaceae bacterium]|nr:alpha/beta fold hydrolase [Thalassobaculaceae bacterium]
MTAGADSSTDSTRAPRPGPRPLPLYLGAAATTWLSSYASSVAWKNGSLDWKPGLSETAATLKAQFDALEAARAAAASANSTGTTAAGADPPPGSFETAMELEVRRRLDLFLSGIERYRHHPYRRAVAEPAVCWKDGSTVLLDYGSVPDARDTGPAGGGIPILVVPSLVNRGYILDLTEQRSLLRDLARRGYRPFLVEWGFPGEAERRFTLTDYVAGRLEAALEAVLAITGTRPALMGYCMGGLLTLALAQRRPRDVAALMLLATPFDFAADAPPIAASLPVSEPWLSATIDTLGWLPTDWIQALFFALDPLLVINKFLRVGRADPAAAEMADFVALEDWLNDGVPLAAPVAREALFDWYGRNTPAIGDWRIAGRTVIPEQVTVPTLAMIPARDRIVPPASARALADRLPNATRADVALGHIGMVVSAGAPKRAWTTLHTWLEETIPA